MFEDPYPGCSLNVVLKFHQCTIDIIYLSGQISTLNLIGHIAKCFSDSNTGINFGKFQSCIMMDDWRSLALYDAFRLTSCH